MVYFLANKQIHTHPNILWLPLQIIYNHQESAGINAKYLKIIFTINSIFYFDHSQRNFLSIYNFFGSVVYSRLIFGEKRDILLFIFHLYIFFVN